MKAAPLLVQWHNDSQPIYSAHFEPHGKGRLATGGGDGNVRLWKLKQSGDDRIVTYLSTLIKHTQAVNVVRWCPRGELLGSAGDDGNVLLWVPAENQSLHQSYGEDGLEDKETWRVKHMCRSSGAEIYDMAWSPDGVFFITGSMDNIARIYNASTGQAVRQIAEHNHYVQGVAWDPLNEFVATQSSDRSVHIYTLKTKDGQFSLAQHSRVAKMDLPARRISSNSPAPPDFANRAQLVAEGSGLAPASPAPPSAPGTPNSLAALRMNPPPTSHSRRSSFGSSPSRRRSMSPAPCLPLPAVMSSNSPSLSGMIGMRNTNIYHNETLTSFFRRLTFAPDGSLLFTPAGRYKTSGSLNLEPTGSVAEIINTVYIYTRAGLNKPPIAYLPGHKKPSVAVRCSPVFYTLRGQTQPTKQITIDTASAEDELSQLPEPAMSAKSHANSAMDPPPLSTAPSPAASATTAPSPKPADSETPTPVGGPPPGPVPAFGLPYRMIYAVATQDAIHVYDTQQQKPLCIVSNLHFATFTDLSWATDGNTLLMTSSDGFCSTLTFQPGELGSTYHGTVPIHHTAATATAASTPTPVAHNYHTGTVSKHIPANINTTAIPTVSPHSTPTPTPTSLTVPTMTAASPAQSASGGAQQASTRPVSASNSTMEKQAPFPLFAASTSSFTPARPASPARSMSASSIATQASFVPGATPAAAASFLSQQAQGQGPGFHVTSGGVGEGVLIGGPIPSVGAIPSVAAAHSAPVGGAIFTPPQTPSGGGLSYSAASSVTGIMHGIHPSTGSIGSVTRRESDADSTVTNRDVVMSIEGSGVGVGQSVVQKREGEESEGQGTGTARKKRRVQPTLVEES